MARPRVIRIGGRLLDFTGDDDALAALHPALARLDTASEGGEARLTVLSESDPLHSEPWRSLEVGSYRDAGGAHAVVRRNPSILETYEPGDPHRLEVRVSPGALCAGDLRAQPAQHAIASWFASQGSSPPAQMIHAGAAAFDGKAVLFVGAGGRGKSTTTLACVREGFAYLGDDLCVVEPGDPAQGSWPLVHGIYATAKLNEDSRAWLGVDGWSRLGTTPAGKAALLLPAEVSFLQAAPLAAIIAVRNGAAAGSSAELTPLSPAGCIGLLGSTALPVASGSGTPRQWLTTAAALARTIPAFELTLAPELSDVISAVHRVLEQSAGRVGSA